ncbi:MAG: AhpC/TSA family protein [Bacteroidales bacterium]|nr:AhpC/TSA family protein [Bacteroidales bacterium]
MKNSILFLLACFFFASCSVNQDDKTNYTINGTIDGNYSNYIYLFQRGSGEWIVLDSVLADTGSFVYKGTIELPELLYISDFSKKNHMPVFIEQGEMVFSTTLNNFIHGSLTGSATHEEYKQEGQEIKSYYTKLEQAWGKIQQARTAEDPAAEAKFQEEYDKTDEGLRTFILNKTNQNNTSVVPVYFVLRNAYYYDENDLEPVVTGVDASITGSVYVTKLKDRVETLKRVAIGQPAIDFTMNDPEGNPVKLSSLYGNYLLIDFWASWCGPCRRENPNLVSAYNKYNKKGFEIFGVSFDKDKDKWLEAIADDNLIWNHVSDLIGWGNAAGKLYAIKSIPSNTLLDPDGKIIAKNLRGEDLIKKLEEIFDK